MKRSMASFQSGRLFQLIVLLLIVVGANMLSELIYGRFDLTREKKFTLSETSRELAISLEDPIYFHVFLEGDFPSEYRRLKRATRDMLNEFRRVGGKNIEFKFEDVLSGKEIAEKEDVLRQLSGKGLQITQPELEADELAEEKYIIPGALVFYKGEEYTLNLLKREFGKPLEEEINGSIELLEYEIANVLRKCAAGKQVKIGFTDGHGELEVMEIADIVRSLEDFYTVHRINLNLSDTAATKPYWSAIARDTANSGAILLNGILTDLQSYAALIVAKPRISFKDEELLLLDQYIMRGGKVIWLVDPMIAEMDSLNRNGRFIATDRALNLENLLFRYGIRLNPDLVQDLNCHGIPVINRRGGNKPGFQPWIFYPLLAPDSEHPIVRNLTSQWIQFGSSIDTLGTSSRSKRTVLLHSSTNSRTVSNPYEVSLDILAAPMLPELFPKANVPMAVLLEGAFTSPFAKRQAVKRNVPFELKDTIAHNAMIVISDGDFVRNQVNREGGEIYPLGYDRYASRQFGQPVQFANKKFFLNCVDYLCDDSGIIEIRSKKVVLRLLDKVRVKTERGKWQIVNMVVPVIVIIVFGLLNTVYRRRKYAR
ncbi:MAG: gliding motility-associated ABC transporter substrate-binding protein GldG [Flavobacteriales bacterium]|nr:gliding motility-associated ABC transporter substrate-binding protein GldG [Flavobacteriales bacterium]